MLFSVIILPYYSYHMQKRILNMNGKDFFKNFISRGAVIYTALSIFLLLVSLMLSEESASQYLDAKSFLHIALFSYVLSLGSTLFASGYFSAPVSRLIHALCCNLGFFVFMLLQTVKFANAIIATAILAVIYTAVTVIAGLFRRKHTRIKSTSDGKATRDASSSKPNAKSNNSKSKAGTYENRFS